MKTNSMAETSPAIDSNGSTIDMLARNIVKQRLAAIKGAVICVRDQAGEFLAGDGQHVDVSITVHDMKFYREAVFSGSNGVAAAYRDGLWSCSDLVALLRIMTRNIESVDSFEGGAAKLMNWWFSILHWTRRNNRTGSRKNIRAHYDLGNDMFQLFLDPTMTYSSGIFPVQDSSLEQASLEKLDRICRKLRLMPGDHVVEIGTGWGSFAIHAAKNYGCRVTTTTISREQYQLAEQRVREAGLQDRIELLLVDYRDLTGQYDKLVSIEMIEAVGDKFLPEYLARCAALVKDDGELLIQAITMPDQRYADYLKRSDFIQEFIFPGSCVPSLGAMLKYIGQATDLRVENIDNFGPHYARTLRCWLDNFMANREQIEALGYSREFTRLWEYYLCYCEAGFREKYLGTVHLHLSRPNFERPPLN